MIDVHNKLLEWCEFYGYKQKKVAEAIGVNRATYANYECGRRSPDILQSKWGTVSLGAYNTYTFS